MSRWYRSCGLCGSTDGTHSVWCSWGALEAHWYTIRTRDGESRWIRRAEGESESTYARRREIATCYPKLPPPRVAVCIVHR